MGSSFTGGPWRYPKGVARLVRTAPLRRDRLKTPPGSARHLTSGMSRKTLPNPVALGSSGAMVPINIFCFGKVDRGSNKDGSDCEQNRP